VSGTIQPYRPVNTDDRNEILLPVVGGLKELVYERPGLFIDRPGFIAGAEPDTALGAAVQAISRVNCRIWASRDKANYSQAVNQGNADLCGPYLDSIAERPASGEFKALVEGGQCPVFYNVDISYTIVLGFCENVQTFSEVFALGVLGPLNVFTDNVGTPGGTSNLCDGFSYTNIRLVGASGAVSQRGSGFGVRLNNISVTRADGLPDTCGNAPVQYQPPTTIVPVTPLNRDITINLPGSGPLTVNVDLSPKGDIIVRSPELDVEVEVEVGGSDDGGGGGGGNAPPPGDVGNPGPGESTGEGGDSEGEAPEGSVLVGLLLDLIEAPAGAREFEPGVYRAGAYVYMGTPTGLDQDFAGSMLSDGQFIFAEKENLTRWRVRANNGFNWFVTPYYREVST